jgi:hypothetical protein
MRSDHRPIYRSVVVTSILVDGKSLWFGLSVMVQVKMLVTRTEKIFQVYF